MSMLGQDVAIVTGAGRGIGRAVALELASRGARVLVNDTGVGLDGTEPSEAPALAVAAEITGDGGTAHASHHDVSVDDEVRAMVELCSEKLGEPTILVTCAGISRDAPLASAREEDLRRLVDVHLLGTMLTVQRVSARMKRRDGGRIVVSTGLAGLLGNLEQGGYAAAAAGIYGFARSAAIELQRHRITVNLVAPMAKTRATEALPMFEHVDSMRPEHTVGPYVFFASPLCGDRTGHVLSVAGGRLSTVALTEMPGQFKERENGPWTAEDVEAAWPALVKR